MSTSAHQLISLSIHFSFLAALSFLLYRKAADAPLKRFFFAGLAAKLLAGIVLGLLYTYYYTYGGDTFTFFEDARLLAEVGRESIPNYVQLLLFNRFPDASLPEALVYEEEARSFFLIKLLSSINLATGDNYWLASLYFSLFSFWGMWRLSNALARIFPAYANAAALSFLFCPSVVFWSSGVIKESLVMGVIGLVSAIWLPYAFGQKLRQTHYWMAEVLFAVLLLLVLWKLKYHYFAVYLACTIAFGLSVLITKNWPTQNRWPLAWRLLFSFVSLIALASTINYNLYWYNFLAALTQNHDILYALSLPGNRIEFHHLQPTVMSMVQNLPMALLSGLFRPFAWEWNNSMQLLSGLENLLLLVLALTALWNTRKKSHSPLSTTAFLLALTTGLYILMLAAVLAYSTPNFGTLVRYKVAFLPFLVYILAIYSPFPSYICRKPSY